MSNQQIQKVKVRRLAHVGLWTSDVSALARFYRQVLGFEVRGTSFGNPGADDEAESEDIHMFLTLGDDLHCLGLFTDTRQTPTTGRRAVPRTPLHHLSFEVDTDAELAALAARLKMAGVDLTFGPRDDDPELEDTLWCNDPDNNRIEISVAPEDLPGVKHGRRAGLRPIALQHVALYTQHLESMVDFYTEALGFDISDWLLRERAWLRCNNNHHTLMLVQGKPAIDHIGFSVLDSTQLLRWADHLGQQQIPLLWGPGRHGTSNDLFIRFVDPDGVHIEFSTGMAQYYDRDVTAPPRLWHTRSVALNLWGILPPWLKEDAQA